MKEYTVVFLFTEDRKRILLKNIGNHLGPLYRHSEWKRAASDVGFGAVRDAGVRNLWKLSWIADLELPGDPIGNELERTRLYAYTGTVEQGDIEWPDETVHLFPVDGLLNRSTTITGYGLDNCSKYDPCHSFLIGNGEMEFFIGQALAVLK